jgi:hypothetical protein
MRHSPWRKKTGGLYRGTVTQRPHVTLLLRSIPLLKFVLSLCHLQRFCRLPPDSGGPFLFDHPVQSKQCILYVSVRIATALHLRLNKGNQSHIFQTTLSLLSSRSVDPCRHTIACRRVGPVWITEADSVLSHRLPKTAPQYVCAAIRASIDFTTVSEAPLL